MPDLDRLDFGLARIEEVNLSGLMLVATIFRKAKIVRDADLMEASLRASELNEADLLGANLKGAELISTDLRSVRLDHAIFGDTILVNLYLAETMIVEGAQATQPATGIDRAEHAFPSRLDSSTLARSRGKIHESFLRSCGLSDWEIEAVRLQDPSLNAAQ